MTYLSSIRNHPLHSATVLIIVVVTFVHALFVWNGGEYAVFNSPDANATYTFADRIYRRQPFALDVEHNAIAPYLTTRSTRVVNDTMVPIGPVAFPLLLGLLSSLLFVNVIPLVTVIVAGVGLWVLSRFVVHVFESESIGFVTVALLMAQPAWVYYTNDSLMPNVFFASMCLVTVVGITIRTVAWQRAAGIGAAVALLVRPLDFIVITMASIVFVALIGKHVLTKRTILWFLVTFLLYWLTIRSVTGSWALFHYNVTAAIEIAQTQVHTYRTYVSTFVDIIRDYAFGLPWAMTLIYCASLVASLFVVDRRARFVAVYSWLILVCVTLGILWVPVQDYPDPRVITVSQSYARYLLPFYIAMAPVCAWGIVTFMTTFRSRIARIGYGLVIGCALLSVLWPIIDGPDDSIMAKAATLRSYDRRASLIDRTTEPSAIILTEKADKYVWPGRRVMTRPEEDRVRSIVAVYAKSESVPLYYLTVTMDSEKETDRRRVWNDTGLVLGSRLWTDEEVSLYSVSPSL